ncbi:MAG: hypothetical protein JST17_14605 [Bacteroidetes bacterium]|nr:hypothetical protein [Bacteroidota bacterium]MBS1930722.1 hypothetical protein [Bacteroidota bacterium]
MDVMKDYIWLYAEPVYQNKKVGVAVIYFENIKKSPPDNGGLYNFLEKLKLIFSF